MAYWDKKEEERIENAPEAEMTLEEFEAQAQEKLEADGEYLSRKMQEHKSQFAHITSDGFWFCVYFNNDTQKEEFLKVMGMNPDEKFIQGKEFVRRYHRSISTPDNPFLKEKNPVKEYKDRARVYGLREKDSE